jgi:hypothetical protein
MVAIAPLLLPLLTGLMGSRMMDKQIQADREARDFRAGQYRNGLSPLADTRPSSLALGGAVDTGQPVGTLINPITDVRPRNNQSTITNVRPPINNMQPNVSTNINQSRSNVPLEEQRAVDRVKTLAGYGDSDSQEMYDKYGLNIPDVQLVDKVLTLKDKNGNEATYTIKVSPRDDELNQLLRGIKTEDELIGVIGPVFSKEVTAYEQKFQEQKATEDAKLKPPTRSQSQEALLKAIDSGESLLDDITLAFDVRNLTEDELTALNENRQSRQEPAFSMNDAKAAKLYVSGYGTTDENENWVQSQKGLDLAPGLRLGESGYLGIFGPIEGAVRETSFLGGFQPLTKSGKQINLINAIKRLQAGETLDNFAEIKASGVTFGATNNAELALIRDSGSKLNFTGSINQNMEYAIDMQNSVKDVIGRSALEFAARYGKDNLPVKVQTILDKFNINLDDVARDNKREDMIEFLNKPNGGFVDESRKQYMDI